MSGTSLIELGERATLFIRQGKKLVIKSGATLLIRANAILNMAQNSELIVENGGYICIEQGATLNIHPQAKITIQTGANSGVNPALNLNTSGNCRHLGNEALFTRMGWVELNNSNQNLNFGNQDFTMEFNLKLEPNAQRALASNRTSATTGYMFGINSTGKPFIELNGTTIQFVPLNPTFNNLNVADNLCHHVAVKRQSGTIYFYADGQLVGTGNQSSVANISGVNPYLMNDRLNALPCLQQSNCFLNFGGWMGEARFWNVAVSNAQIAGNYTSSITNLPAGLVAHYLFREEVGAQVIIDRIGNANGWLGLNAQNTDSADPSRIQTHQVGCDINGTFGFAPRENTPVAQAEEVKAFENPFERNFTVRIPESWQDSTKADLLNAQGQILETRTLPTGDTLWTPAQTLPAGLYILRLLGTDKTHILRLIKR